jgi:hypothetical protein
VEGFDGDDQRSRKRRLLSAVVKVCDIMALVTEVHSVREQNASYLFCDCVWFAQVAEEEKPTEIEKELEKTEDIQPDKDDADEETDIADRRPTLQRNYNADDPNPLPSMDMQQRGHTGSSIHTSISGGPRSGGPRRFPKERGFLVRVSNPPSQYVCSFVRN